MCFNINNLLQAINCTKVIKKVINKILILNRLLKKNYNIKKFGFCKSEQDFCSSKTF